MNLRYIYQSIYQVFDSYGILARLGKEIITPCGITIPIIPLDIKQVKSIANLETELAFALGYSPEQVDLSISRGYFDLVIPREESQELRLSQLLEQLRSTHYDIYANPLKLLIGLDIHNKLVILELGTPQASHLLIAGASGAGKSELAKSIISQIVLRDQEQEISLLVYTPKVSDFIAFNSLAELRYGAIIAELSDIENCLADIYGVMETRARYKRVKGPIVVILDEVNSLIALSTTAKEYIELIACKGRSESIHLILICQSAKKENVQSPIIRENIPCRAVFRTHNKRESTTLSNTPEIDCSKLDIGQCYLISSGKWSRVTCPKADLSESFIPDTQEYPLQVIDGGKELESSKIAMSNMCSPDDLVERSDASPKEEQRDIEEMKASYEEKAKILAIPDQLRLEIKELDVISKTKIVELLNISNNKACELLSQLDELKLLLPKHSPVHPSPINKARLQELEERYPEAFGIGEQIPRESGI